MSCFRPNSSHLPLPTILNCVTVSQASSLFLPRAILNLYNPVRSGLVARPSAPGERTGRNGRSRGYRFIRRSKIDRERWLRMLFNLPQLTRNRLVVVTHVFLVLTTVCVLTGSQSLYGALNTGYRYQRPD